MKLPKLEQQYSDASLHPDSRKWDLLVLLVGILLAAMLAGTAVAASRGNWV